MCKADLSRSFDRKGEDALMKREDILDAIGAVKDEYLERTENAGAGGVVRSQKEKKLLTFRKWAGIAACACVLCIVAVPLILMNMGGMGSSEGAGGSNNTDGSTVFMSYAGPVFPMTAIGEVEGVTVERELTYDFQPWIPDWYPEGGYYRSSSDVLVEDAYTLTNTTDTEQEVTLLYPFVSSLRTLEENMAVLTDNAGAELTTKLYIGGYSGGFEPATDDEADIRLLNVEEITSWEQYRELFAGDVYLERALYYEADLSDIPVSVYRFTDDYGPERSEDMPNPTIRAMYEIDYDATVVLSYGFDGGYYDRENNVEGRQFSVRQEGNVDYGEPRYIVVIGEDIANMETEGYVTGGWDTDETIENMGVTVTREETDLDTVLREIVALEHEDVSGYEETVPVDFETYYRLFVEMLETYGLLSDSPIARYEEGMLEFMNVFGLKRVCYVETRVTIPAGEAVCVTATMNKDASFDYFCADTENKGIDGYDCVTMLGSCLNITETTANIEDRDMIEIVRQNFGFDLEAGVKSVSLAPEQEHYYLEVRRKAQEE